MDGWRTDNYFQLACSRLSVVGGERGKKGGDSLGSWGPARKAGERRNNWGETLSVVGGERGKTVGLSR